MQDEVISFYIYDYKEDLYKQDFIVNKDKQYKEFILFTRLPKREYSKYVKDIKEFTKRYSKEKYPFWSHHLKFDELPNNLKERAIQAKRLAEKINRYGLKIPTKEELSQIALKLKQVNTNIPVSNI